VEVEEVDRHILYQAVLLVELVEELMELPEVLLLIQLEREAGADKLPVELPGLETKAGPQPELNMRVVPLHQTHMVVVVEVVGMVEVEVHTIVPVALKWVVEVEVLDILVEPE